LVDDFDGDLKFHCRLNEHIGSLMYWRGAYSWNQLPVLDRNLRDGMVFVDVGANQGEFTVFAAKRLPVGRVVAFEPMTDMYDRLLRNIEANGFSNVLASRLGLWSEPTTRTIYRRSSRFSDGSHHEGLGTVFPTDVRNTRVEEIQCTTLDAFLDTSEINRVDIIKIDVEGAELRVLQGASRTIDRHRPKLLIEVDLECCRAAGVDPPEFLDYLERLYRLHLILPSGRTRPLKPSKLRTYQNLLGLPR
jgi:FkbM family methyltransferase